MGCFMKNKIKFLIPSIITIVILLILFYIQGLYPFSNNSIVQVDADYQYIPILYRIYDFLHGSASIIYDDIGLGNNIYISMIIQGSIFSPLSLLLYFTSRENLINYFNIIVIIKMSLLCLTSYIYINNTYKINEYYKVLFSILYTFSGWVLLNYFNIMWLDSVILFPLIVMYLNKLLKEEKYIGYIITLSLSLIISYYISYFILLFILFYSYIYIFLKIDKSKRKKIIFILGISTLISILISCFSLLPALYQTFISSRIDSITSNSSLLDNFMNKSLFILFSPIFIILFISLLFRFKQDKKNIYIFIILIILFGIGLFIEPINLGLHLGSYWSFPYRYSFITLFILLNASIYYISKYQINGITKYKITRGILLITIISLLLYLNNKYYNDVIDSQIVLDFNNIEVYYKIITIFLLITITILLSLSYKGLTRYILLSIVSIIQIFIFSSYSMYYNSGYFLTKNSNIINSNLNLENNLYRYKMAYTDYTPDYGFIYNVSTLDNWIHILPSNQINIYNKLGYGNTDTCIRSYGGTIFTDWLFNVGYLLDNGDNNINNNMYTLIDNYDNYYLYKYNYNSSFGIVYNKENELENIEYLNNFTLQNKIYQNLFNTDKEIINISNYVVEENDYHYKLNYSINELENIYIYLYNKIDYIIVNNKYISITDDYYIIDLGMYSEDIEIEIYYSDTDYLSYDIGTIKYSDIMNLKGNVSNVFKIESGYNINVYNDLENGYLFLPLNNIPGLEININNRKVNIESYLDNFVSIKLDEGQNTIEIKYHMPLFKLGIILSIIGIICLIILKNIPYNKIILNITSYIYILINILFYLYYYVYALYKYYLK